MRDDTFDDDDDPSDDVAYDNVDIGPDDFPMVTDFVAERVIAFAYLAEKFAVMDDEVKPVAIDMLRVVMRSIKTPEQASLSVVRNHD